MVNISIIWMLGRDRNLDGLEMARIARGVDHETFEREPHFAAAVQVRRWDDEAKVAGLEVAPFDAYQPLLDALAR